MPSASSRFLASLTLAGAVAVAPGCGGTTSRTAEEQPPGPQRDNPAELALTRNGMQQIIIAVHFYHDNAGYLPPAALCDANGKPLLSWRVAVLPYMEQGPLYKQFKLDEPWDSDHNKKLLEKIPKQYAPPRGANVPAGHTFVRAFAGKDAVFADPKTRVTLAAVTNLNGLSNTIFAVEAGEAVPWTAPDELVFDPKAPPRLGGAFVGGFHALMGDGSLRFLRKDAPPDVLAKAVNWRNTTPFDIDVLDVGRKKP